MSLCLFEQIKNTATACVMVINGESTEVNVRCNIQFDK